MRKLRLKTRLTALLLALCLLLSGCGTAETLAESLTIDGSRLGGREPQSADFVPYETPPFATSEFHAALAEGNSAVRLDLSALSEGYVAVSVLSEKRLKFQVLKDDWTYNYDIASDGTPSIFPLQCGDGLYTFRVMENVGDSRYAQIYAAEREVTLADEFQPFLRPSNYSRYTPDSDCVRKAAELAASCESQIDVVKAVYRFVCSNISYDTEKAATVKSGYMPDPDETLSTRKGICFDYAALAAAMLRSQGIPTKLIFGYVAPDDLYHAWNMFYTEESGWVTVSFEVSGQVWTRLDLTFSAGGASDRFVGDGSHYRDLYSY